MPATIPDKSAPAAPQTPLGSWIARLTPAPTIAAAITGKVGDGHTTSGLDAAMQAQANKMHPAK